MNTREQKFTLQLHVVIITV